MISLPQAALSFLLRATNNPHADNEYATIVRGVLVRQKRRREPGDRAQNQERIHRPERAYSSSRLSGASIERP